MLASLYHWIYKNGPDFQYKWHFSNNLLAWMGSEAATGEISIRTFRTDNSLLLRFFKFILRTNFMFQSRLLLRSESTPTFTISVSTACGTVLGHSGEQPFTCALNWWNYIPISLVVHETKFAFLRVWNNSHFLNFPLYTSHLCMHSSFKVLMPPQKTICISKKADQDRYI